MIGRKDYLREVQKFTTSQYWNSGLRITVGVMLPLLVLEQCGWLAEGIPFLWGALFVSLTDTPGPIHHRRNGMVAAIFLNAIVVAISGFTKDHHALQIAQIIVAGFLLTMAGIYGARAGAVGSLALVVMLLNLLTYREGQDSFNDSLLIAGGGTWYMILSLLLYRLKPYRLVEQGLGESLIAMADYVRARAAFYKQGADLPACYNRMMEEQRDVKNIQDQIQELIFKTRKFVADASPKSRSMMMIYLDSLDLFEQVMHSYQDYEMFHRTLSQTTLLTGLYGLILQLAAGLEHIGMAVQGGVTIKKNLDLTAEIDALHQAIQEQLGDARDADIVNSLDALEKTIVNIQNITNRINKLVLYTRLEANLPPAGDLAQQVSNTAATQPITLQLFRENLTLEANTFRHALRLTAAMIAAYGVAILFSLTHAYWVLLTIVTIMKPVYSVTRKRNIQRVGGTLAGVVLVSVILYLIDSNTVLLMIMVASMLLGYSLLRVNYFVFVVFLTIFVVITFHFLNPIEFKNLISERLVDTIIGSVIAAAAARFILPVWGHDEIRDSMINMLEANRHYFLGACTAPQIDNTETIVYESTRREAVVALTNLSEKFQHMLAEPLQSDQSAAIHQFVIASHMLTGHIAALSTDRNMPVQAGSAEMEAIKQGIVWQLQQAENYLFGVPTTPVTEPAPLLAQQSLSQLSMIFTLARDIRRIALRLPEATH